MNVGIMNTYLSRLCSLAFVVLVLSACGGGGGGGGGGGTPTAKTTPTTITVIDGYIKGAVVCVDKNKNGSCDSGETKGETGPNGKVTLDIPLEDVGKYPIVAYIPADAIDLDNPSAPVGKAYTMAAPADQSAIVSPLSTLVKRLIDKDGKTTAQASLQISSTVGDPSIDYIQSKNAQARMAAKMLAELMQDPSKLLLPSNTTDSQKQAAMADAMLDVLPYIQSKAQNLSASMSACASDIGGAGCQEAVAKALSGVMQTASITGASSSNTPVINSGGRTDSLAITLSGTYSGNALGSDYSMLNIQVVVKQHIQTGPFADVYKEYFGIYSEPFKVKIGNKLTPSSTQLSTWDEWVLTLSNVWRNVRTAVITFVADASDMVDGLVTRTLSGIDPMYMQQRGQSLSISAGFKTTGDKAVNIAYLDGNGQTVSTDSVRLTVNAAGAVTQIPTVDAITSIANQPIEKNGSTRETVSSVDGSLSAAIGKFYYVEVYDNGSNTALPGTMSYNENRTKWTFTPSAPLAIGSHDLTAAVVRGDGVSGARSVSALNFTLTQPRLIKIGANGTALANQNAQWSDTGNEVDGTRWDCILEFDTGRMWEVKPKSPNQLRSADFTFTYYIPNPRVAGSWVGSETTNGSCNSLQSGKKCNTQNYIEAVNSVGLCGKKDWRLPTQTDVAQQVKGFPKLYFPNLTWFWIESDTPTYGWYVEAYSTVQAEVGPFTYGSDDANDVAPVILVRNSR